MKHIVIGIFAHPDDETFGPGGSLALYAQEGLDVHVITCTDGSLGGNHKNLVKVREQELSSATKILGLSGSHSLGFIDGTLSNDKYDAILQKLVSTIKAIVGTKPTKVTFITFDQSGITGHLDHIAVSLITTCLYSRLPQHLPNITEAELQYYCITDQQRPKSDANYFIYCPCGCPSDSVDISRDVSSVLDTKKKAIQAYSSQQKDVEKLLSAEDHVLAVENFKIYKEEH